MEQSEIKRLRQPSQGICTLNHRNLLLLVWTNLSTFLSASLKCSFSKSTNPSQHNLFTCFHACYTGYYPALLAKNVQNLSIFLQLQVQLSLLRTGEVILTGTQIAALQSSAFHNKALQGPTQISSNLLQGMRINC